MSNCYDQGQLRAYLDGELTPLERGAIGAHAAVCAVCRSRLAELRTTASQVRAQLAQFDASPDPRAAFARLQGRLAVPTQEPLQRSKPMQSSRFWSGRRNVFAGVAALVVALSLLALPPVRAAATNLLSIFRVQQIMFVPVDQARIEQLQNLKLDGKAPFVGQPNVSRQSEPKEVASAAEASSETGYAVGEAATLPGPALNTTYTVIGPGTAEFQIDVPKVRQVLQGLGITDIDIPDALGTSPIKVSTQPFVSTHYRGAGYDLTLNQGRSPEVALPDGVDLAQLGTVALRVLDMTPEQAAIASSNIDWNSTLIFPFPADTANIRQVAVNGQKALLVQGGGRGNQHWQLYWQNGDHFYMLQSQGGGQQDEDAINMLIATAESVR